MGIEDIPEMQVLNGIDNGKWKKPDFSKTFTGRFIVFTLDLRNVDLDSDKIATLSDKNYIFCMRDPFDDYEFYSHFYAWLESFGSVRYGKIGESHCYASIQKKSSGGDVGGNLFIYQNKIEVRQDPFPENRDVREYDEKVVRPIAERWKQRNLPNHELVFE